MSLNYQWAKLLMPRLGSIGERMMVNHSEHQMYPKVVHRHIATICDEIKARLYSEWETAANTLFGREAADPGWQGRQYIRCLQAPPP